MAEVTANNKFISKGDSGFPPELEWEKLRAVGLDHIGKLSGKLWTDHNVHDPGITILEILCYSLMDLGYRTSLPVADILTPNPDDKSKEDNFFTPAEILTCNPVTITDFRKLLIDIPGVKNAWLDDSFYACIDKKNASPSKKETFCSDCYNGLYRVYVETETDDTNVSNPEIRELISMIRQKLMAHRNLCEDFADIRILCKKEVGLCVDIELEKDADAEQVYQAAVNQLIDFFSTAPRFYTLAQLLIERKKTIEEIYAGRPYALKESHGFLDTEELERSQLRKEIHFSDLYQVLLKVPGVRNVSRLAWKKDGQPCLEKAGWTFNIPQDHVLKFSPEASVFTFVREGVPVSIDTDQFNDLFKLGLSSSGKVLYKSSSPYLELAMPTGIYRSDLGEYQSMQNDFPRVYGISPGGLPSTASDRRKAQAYQLKGYLLFFDQLLANYLAQLQNIRPLFSFSTPRKKSDKRTYFISPVDDIPDIEKLLRFSGSKASNTIPGIEGDILARPVLRSEMEQSILNGKLNRSRCDAVGTPYYYRDHCSVQIAIKSWQQDLRFGEEPPVIFSTNPRCWMFYLVSADPTVVLLGNKIYATENEAYQAAESTIYAGAYADNFTASEDENRYSFNIQLRVSSYLQYLKDMVENESLFLKRRGQFLDHLLSRFAERFTDFALLSFGMLEDRLLKEKEINQKEQFLQQYGDLSSNRGKAYDYLRDGWNNGNLSGFEKRAMAIAGMNGLKRKHLCNYVVEKFEEYYQIVVKLSSGEILFEDPEKFYSRESAELALKDLLHAIRRWENYPMVSADPPFMVSVSFGENKLALYKKVFATQEEALLARNGLFKLIEPVPENTDVIVNKIVQRPSLKDSHGETVAQCTTPFDDQSVFKIHVREHPDFFQDPGNWTRFERYPANADMIYDEENASLINWTAFSFYSRRNIVRKPGKYGYELLDSENSFRLFSEVPHDSAPEAEEAAKRLLKRIASDPECLSVVEDNDEYYLEVRTQALVEVKTEESKDRQEIVQLKAIIIRIVRANVYPIVFVSEASTWKFRFIAGHETDQFEFRSVEEYQSPKDAFAKATLFFENVNKDSLHAGEHTLSLNVASGKNELLSAEHALDDESKLEATRQRVEDYLAIRSEIRSDLSQPDELGEKYIINDIGDARLRWVYRLVDKDNLLAFYIPAVEPNDLKNVEDKRKDLYQNPPSYEYSEIVMSQESIAATDEERTRSKYSYRIIRKGADKEDTVLFESVKRFETRENAWQAFQENYLTILNAARDPENYGSEKMISLDQPIRDTQTDVENSSTLVYIPETTKEYYSWHDNLAIEALVRIASQYRVRYVTKEDDEFYDLFKCEDDDRDKPIVACPRPKEGIRYYYFVLSNTDGAALWQGNKYYSSRQEALEQFRFFLSMLRYPGNFTIERDYCECKPHINGDTDEPCVCHSKIWIREVLAESKKRFPTQTAAWADLERFICIAQSTDSFHAFQRLDDCSFTFDVMCRSGLVHPIAYHSQKDRNDAMGKLHQAFEEFKTRRIPSLQSSNAGWQLIDARNEIIADVAVSSERYLRELCLADLFYELFENLQHYQNETGVIIKHVDKTLNLTETITVKPHQPDMDPFTWAALLNTAADNYPIVKKANGKYYVVLRLVGFGLNNPSATRGAEAITTCNRYAAAWEGLCCFDNCRDARVYLREVQNCLSEFSNYRGVYACECGPYRIELICRCNDDRGGKNSKDRETPIHSHDTNAKRKTEHAPCCDEVIAYNPQRYHTPGISCLAIERAKMLINAEGLHLVEHILLRPRCPEDCRGNQFPKLTICPEGKVIFTGEKLEWRSTWAEDAVDNRGEAIEFQPGKDPYSFIASVFLPAWPQRFRSKENRLIIENLLYRETPAHIMLRVIWLRPVDFCELEFYFKRWHVWISRGGSGHCIDEDPRSRLVELLINRKFEEMEACDVCSPCKEETQAKSCFELEQDPCDDVTVLKNINDLYCWLNGNESIVASAPVADIKEQELTHPQHAASPDPRVKGKILNQRLEHYRSQIRNTNFERNPLAEEVDRFLKRPKPERKAFILLAQRILKKETSSGTKVQMSRDENVTLFRTLVFFYLDKVIVHGKSAMAGKPLQDFFSALNPKKVDKEELFKTWEPDNLIQMEKGISVEEVKRIVTGK